MDPVFRSYYIAPTDWLPLSDGARCSIRDTKRHVSVSVCVCVSVIVLTNQPSITNLVTQRLNGFYPDDLTTADVILPYPADLIVVHSAVFNQDISNIFLSLDHFFPFFFLLSLKLSPARS